MRASKRIASTGLARCGAAACALWAADVAAGVQRARLPTEAVPADAIGAQKEEATTSGAGKESAARSKTAQKNPSVRVQATAAMQEKPVSSMPFSLPIGGGDKTGASSQAISFPQGAGKIQGMGESFSAQMSTGTATFSVPFLLPAARGGAQPSLSLSYNSGSGHGIAGVGWEVGVASISRQTDRGLPAYLDPSSGTWGPAQDRFIFNGGQELVPICVVGGGGSCSGAAAGEVIPAWFAGWQYFRPRVEGAFERFFWSPDHATWRVQSKTGTTMELGVPLDGSSYLGGVESDPENASHIFRWNLVREYDAYGGANPTAPGTAPTPVNVVLYRYLQDGGTAYLQDIYDTTPVGNPTGAPLAGFAHHTRLDYAPRTDATTSYRRGWLTSQGLRLVGVDVTSQPFTGGTRTLLRRYHLGYDDGAHVSLLISLQMEGRCSDALGNEVPIAEDATGALPGTLCPTLPAMTFDYQHVTPFSVDGTSASADLAGYEGFDERITDMGGSPPNSIDENATDFFDIDSDGLPDVVVTLPGQDALFPFYRNGLTGQPNQFTLAKLGVAGVLGATATTINLINPNVAVLDIDGDGTIDWLHQPAPKTYAVYTPQLVGGGWTMVGRNVVAAALQDPRLDLGEDTPDINVFDANGDGLADVVRATGTNLQTFFSLGRFPAGDGNFGSAMWTGPGTAETSLHPVTTCVPLVAPGQPVRFSDPSIRMGDMNGDGLQDIVYLHPGDTRYWPGRGDGSFGTGTLGACVDGFAENTYVPMADAPDYSDTSGTGLRIDDVNGDGLDDLVQVRFDAIDIWLNVDGAGFTPMRHTIAIGPQSSGPTFASKVRLVDVNGSGTRDVVWGEGGHYRFIDLSGGERPWVLTHVQNGLGKTTDIQYASSTTLMLAARAAGNAWASVTPTPVHVVVQETESDHLDLVGRPPGTYVTQYSYRDPVYDGRQREFRGFRTATSRKVGDANSPSSTAQTTFLLGECENDEALAVDPCTSAGRWEDNPREALKGLPVLSETFDDNGVYQSTAHHTYRLRKLYTGLDGREVRQAFESATDTFLYDDGPFVPASQVTSLTDVELETTPGSVAVDVTSAPTLRATAGRAHLQKATAVDVFGNTTDTVDYGCVDGCAVPEYETITAHTTQGLPPALGQASIDATDWMYRPLETYVLGSVTPGQRKHLFNTYDAGGSLTQTTAALVGTLPLNRFHQTTGAAVAPPPPQASVDGTILVVSKTYDGFGQLTVQSAANGRCRDFSYDTLFGQLTVQEDADVGPAGTNGCGTTLLTTKATAYDRGLAVVLRALSPQGELTVAQYDGLGRLAALFKPDPTTLGQASPVASLLLDYTLPTDPTLTPFSIVHTQTQNGPDAKTAQYHAAYAYSDGLGRALVTLDQADPSAGDGGQWIASGLADYDAKGSKRRAYLASFWSGAGNQYPAAAAAAAPYGSQRYDAFGRQLQTFNFDGAISLQSVYHAMSIDKWDAADLLPGPHQGTPASSTTDGHGRTVVVSERIHNGTSIEQRDVRTLFLSSGEAAVISRVRVGASDPPIVRWMQYDSLGRMVLNVEPDATAGYVAPPSPAGPLPPPTTFGTLATWHYAYDDNGDLVGTSDARGCGANYLYDAGGRGLAEDFSPCLAAHAAYSAPNTSTGDGTEVFYAYDAYDTDSQGIPGFAALSPTAASTVKGRVAFVADRGAKTATLYDGRGRAVVRARRLPTPTASNTLAARYATATWYAQTASFDGADRKVTVSTGLGDVAALLPGGVAGAASTVTAAYSAAGNLAAVSSSYGTLVASILRDADRRVTQVVYGDVASTTTSLSYDGRRRLSTALTYRGTPAIWKAPPASYLPAPTPTGAPTTFQLLLEDEDYVYDAVDNPSELRDWRNPAEWPAGAQPVTRKIQYDDLYRATQISYTSPSGPDAWTSPFDAEDKGINTDSRRSQPSPHVGFTSRVVQQSYAYDWLGNTAATDDDAHGFYDRSLGTVANGTAAAGPYQMQGATGVGARGGSLSVAYDAAGNVTGLSVVRSGPCLPSGGICSQRFAYDWDEVGRMARARRWDLATPGSPSSPTLPPGAPAADLSNVYDFTDQRTMKSATSSAGTVYSAYIFDSLELRRAAWSGTDYVRSNATEVGYLEAHGVRLARLHYAATSSTPTESGSALHVLLELQDHLASTSTVIDRDTGEVAERATYTALGEPDSDYRPTRWDSFREDYRFTGKEDDVEVGLKYFGKRILSSPLGRWMSVDPLTLHGIGADANGYAYVRGSLLRSVDPMGLEDQGSPVQPAFHYHLSGETIKGGGEPSWLQSARADLGIREGANDETRNPEIAKYLQPYKLRWKNDTTSWCAAFVNHHLTESGYAGSKGALATTFLNSPNMTQLPGPAVGAIGVRAKPILDKAGNLQYDDKGQLKIEGHAHAFIVVGKDDQGNVIGLGGNQGYHMEGGHYETNAKTGKERWVEGKAVVGQGDGMVNYEKFDPNKKGTVLFFAWPSEAAAPAATGIDSLPNVGSDKALNKSVTTRGPPAMKED